jgi:ribonuclease HII
MICGIDEAGRGPVMGPLMVAGVAIESEQPLVDLNVRDSKKLSAARRDSMAVEIRKLANIEIMMISARELDILQQTMSLNEVETVCFSKIIRRLRPDAVYVDCVDTNEDNFKKNLGAKLDYTPKIISKHGADDIFPVVSAASIIAKTERDLDVSRISSDLGEDIGSGYPADPVTVEFVKNWLYRKGILPPHIRHSWKTTKRLWEDFKYQPTTLNDF